MLLACLVLPTLWLALHFYRDFYSVDKQSLATFQIVGCVCLISYVFIILGCGIESFLTLIVDEGYQRQIIGTWSFILPGIAFALVIFPYQASELCANYMSLSQLKLNYYLRWLGLLVFLFIGIRHWLVLF
ncbi:hypothetical protein [Flocculibacter collagenilyticus]|uniref:hypothetical protein n=1 Tax=Flocculibacter collagenilyticus TaxID=2744479 RepID=UPI0018F6BDF1|nr:hypothetical protein [Flocculibacter collagenilyticus]